MENNGYLKPEKGKWYKCIRTVEMKDDGEIVYIEGKTYPSEINGCITDEDGDKNHYWDVDCDTEVYFAPIDKTDYEKVLKKSKDDIDDKISKRKEYNLKCLDVIKQTIEKYPDWRFMQVLYNMELCEDRFYEESVDTFKKLPKI